MLVHFSSHFQCSRCSRTKCNKQKYMLIGAIFLLCALKDFMEGAQWNSGSVEMHLFCIQKVLGSIPSIFKQSTLEPWYPQISTGDSETCITLAPYWPCSTSVEACEGRGKVEGRWEKHNRVCGGHPVV